MASYEIKVDESKGETDLYMLNDEHLIELQKLIRAERYRRAKAHRRWVTSQLKKKGLA